MTAPRCVGTCRCLSECEHPAICCGATGARLATAWPYTGTPTTTGPLSDAELDAYIAQRYPSPAPRIPRLPLSVAPARRDQHPAEAISGPHSHRLGLWDRIVWRWRVWRAERMGPAVGVR